MATFIENEHKYLEDPVTEPRFDKRRTWKTIFCSKLAKGIIVALIVATLIPTLAFFYALSANVPDGTVQSFTCLIIEDFRLPCGNADISEEDCEKVNCCFNSTTQQCHHYLPSKYYYTLTDDGTYKASQDKSPVGTTTLPEIKLTIQKKTAKQVSFIIHDPSEAVESLDLTDTNYTIVLDDTKLNVNVSDEKGNTIFSTFSYTLIASDMFWEWGFQLSSEALFGLDRNRIQLQGNATLTKVIYKNRNDHYTLPVLWAYQGGSFYGILIRHDGPLEIQVLASHIVILRTIVGSKLEVELSLGPTPADLYNIQTENFVPPPLWALGTHNCRKGNSTILGEILSIYKENDVTSLFGTECIHENLFVALQNSSVEPDNITVLQEILSTFSDSGTKFLFSLPPHILINDNNPLYNTAKNLNILYRNQSSGNIYNGTYLGTSVAFPDFSNSTLASQFMQALVEWIDSQLGLDNISGFVLNDNWPQDDSYVNVDKTDLSYYSEELDKQITYTLPWNLKDTNGVSHLKNHNLYGEYQNFSLYTYLSSIKDNPLIISSTKTHSSSEPEISDNLETSWTNFNTYLNKILFSSISGNPMVGLPVCGDTTTYDKELHETLCVRWYLAAAVMPYFRVSSGSPFRDPNNLNTLYSTGIAQQAMSKRNLIQDYLFTLFHTSPPVVRPMYFDYFSNETTLSMESQYAIGENIIVAHPLSSGRTRLQVYLPPSKGVWYEFWGGTRFSTKDTSYADIDLLDSDLVMFVAQGTIVALTNSSQLNLYIALNCTASCVAEGELMKDENLLHFSATETDVIVSGLPLENCEYLLGNIRVYHQVSNFYSHNSSNENVLCSAGESVTITYTSLN